MIARTRHVLKRGRSAAGALCGAALAASCAAPQSVAPPPAPKPVVARPAPPPPVPAPADWRDAAQTAGTWRWALEGGNSAASFGVVGYAPVARMVCERAKGRVILMRSGNASAAVPMAVRTTSTMRPLSSDPVISPQSWLALALPARDPLLDAIAFSRGRFAFEAAGLATLYLPAQPELSRVIEDCR